MSAEDHMRALVFIIVVVGGAAILAWAVLAAYGWLMKSRKEDKQDLWKFPNDGF
jgi:hypothetical protein